MFITAFLLIVHFFESIPITIVKREIILKKNEFQIDMIISQIFICFFDKVKTPTTYCLKKKIIINAIINIPVLLSIL